MKTGDSLTASRRIVAIGGGSMLETEPINAEIVRTAGVPSPKLLFIPTASDDNRMYSLDVHLAFGRLGCLSQSLWLWSVDGSAEAAAEKIRRADIIYVGGGNTKKMLERWRELHVDRELAVHARAGKPVAGLSAGALCWFRVGNSDWPQYEKIEGVNTAPLVCMGWVDLILCPHATREPFRLAEFREMMRSYKGPGVALDDGCALQIHGNTYRILSSIEGAVAHRIEWVVGSLRERELAPCVDFQPLRELYAG